MMKMQIVSIAGPELKKRQECVPLTEEALLARPVENEVINLFPEITYQKITGFGGAMTEAAAWSLSLLPPEEQKAALEEYFGENGAGYTVIRTHIDSCDFSRDMYQAVEDVLADPELKTFSLKRDKEHIIPMIKAAMEISAKPISVLLSPWSPPAEWKTESQMLKSMGTVEDMRSMFPPEMSDEEIAESHPVAAAMMEMVRNAPKDGSGIRCCGGHLKKEYYGSWAAYITKYIQGYLEEGIPVRWVSIQNEAQAATPWDSCQWTPEEEKEFLSRYLYPAMKQAGVTDQVGIFFWDHNKENLVKRVFSMMDEETEKMIAGVAFHWYSGDHFEAVRIVHERFPQLKLMLTEECCGFSKDDPEQELGHACRYAHDIIGNLNEGMDTWFDWNLFLDEKGGPNHVNNFCSSPVMLDGKGSYVRKASYHFLRAFSENILPGAARIGWSKYTDQLDVTAAADPDGTLVCIVLNRGKEERPVHIRLNGYTGAFQADPESITVVKIPQE